MTITELLDGHDFSELADEIEPDDIVVDAVVLLRVTKPEDFGRGTSSLIVGPETGLDPIVLTGMLHQALHYDDLDH